MSWKDSDFISQAFCIANSSYGSRERMQKVVEDKLREAYEAGKCAERRSQEARRVPTKRSKGA